MLEVAVTSDGHVIDPIAKVADGYGAAEGKPPTQVITFDDLVTYGKLNGGNIVNGMPWSFKFRHWHVTHESDDCYLLCYGAETIRFNRGDRMLLP